MADEHEWIVRAGGDGAPSHGSSPLLEVTVRVHDVAPGRAEVRFGWDADERIARRGLTRSELWRAAELALEELGRRLFEAGG